MSQYCLSLCVYLYNYLIDPNKNESTKIRCLRNIARITRKRVLKHTKKNAYKKTLQRVVLEGHDDSELIHNLSSFVLTPSHTKVVSKGLSFVLTPKPTPMKDIHLAFSKFCRRLYLRAYFLNKPNREQFPFHLPSVWEPPIPENDNITQYVSRVRNDPNYTRIPHTLKSNLSFEEKNTLDELISNTDIIIKPADKGGKIVLWDRNDYIKEAHRQLNDQTYYTQIDHNPLADLILEISSFISYLYRHNYINYQLFSFLDPKSSARIPIFYLLPKIHKPGTPGRPIISGCDSPTTKLSIFIDYYLKPIVKRIPSYIHDTTHFLRTLRGFAGTIPQNSILVTFDVKSLYTNIPHDEGINYCSIALHQYYTTNLPIPVIHMRQLISFILKKNYFQFQNNFYLQIHGTAMGSPFAPNYANIFMDNIERQILDNAPNNNTPILWLRFIDDIFAIWTYGQDSLLKFFDHMNTIHPTIKFEMSHSRDRIPFLDTTVILTITGHIETTLYRKPTDISPLLHAQSFHPINCKTSIIYSQALRYRRIISDNNEFEKQLQVLRRTLIKRGYNIGRINEIFNNVRLLSRDNLLQYQDRPPTHVLPFVVPFNWNTLHIGRILHLHWHLIQNDENLQEISMLTPIMAFRRQKNIRDLLVHSNLDHGSA